jgi:uncharacterized phage-associated protein
VVQTEGGPVDSSVHDVAAAVLSRLGEVTTWKLQKLVYYSQAWYLVRYGEPLFTDVIEAWREGPVIRELFNHHRKRSRVVEWPKGDEARLSGSQLEVIDEVVKEYGGFSAETLSLITHSEAPWLIAREMTPSDSPSSNVIDRKIISSFYARQSETPDNAVSLAIANAALEGQDLDAEWEGKLRDVADGSYGADDLIQREIQRIRGD